MPTLDDLLHEFPASSRAQLRALWEALPADAQQQLSRLPLALPGDLTLFKMLARMSAAQFRMAFGDKRAVAIVGPANVGKSTLYNQFVQEKSERAQVSPIPGTTRHNQRSDAGLFAVVDTPGADAVGEVGEAEKEHAFAAANQADLLVIMFDAVQGVKRTEQELFRELSGLGKPYVVALNKLDLVRGAQAEVLAKAAANLHLAPEQVIGIAARSGQDVERVLIAIAKAEPAILAALGQALPAYRWRLALTAISGAASTSAVIALTPLPLLDFIPLIAVQSSMVLGIARIYDYKITAARARELVAAFGLGYLGR
ncbi:MAG: 50S ribosome-binding GTPase, partial [Chloroflexi bacterium]|nr:50S ribosome-binding GTPase [Chloroflexota bacterium]